ncbi:MAG: hypothetical protein CMJ77_22645 [Planctomycetaceae bacterium]|nr:hypothetical protein [Planctomycetaceae bacterium]
MEQRCETIRNHDIRPSILLAFAIDGSSFGLALDRNKRKTTDLIVAKVIRLESSLWHTGTGWPGQRSSHSPGFTNAESQQSFYEIRCCQSRKLHISE